MIVNEMGEATRKGKKATSYDVAKLAGVSQATVSLVMNQRGTQFGITAETEARVREAAAQLSYYPNALLRSVRKGATGIVGVYGRDRAWSQRSGYWIEALGALHVAAADLDRELLLFSDHPDRSVEHTLERMLSGILDGLIVQPSEHNEVIDRLVRSRLPLVAMGDPYPGLPSVTIDNEGGVEMAVAHLVAQGRRSLAFLNFASAGFGAPKVREEAFLRTAGKAGVLSEAGAVRLYDGLDVVLPRLVDTGIDGLVVINDEYAYAALRELLALGVRVPERVAVVGFDGIPAPFAPYPVTTIRSPIEAMCRLALERLLALVDGGTIPELTTLPVELAVGETG